MENLLQLHWDHKKATRKLKKKRMHSPQCNHFLAPTSPRRWLMFIKNQQHSSNRECFSGKKFKNFIELLWTQTDRQTVRLERQMDEHFQIDLHFTLEYSCTFFPLDDEFSRVLQTSWWIYKCSNKSKNGMYGIGLLLVIFVTSNILLQIHSRHSFFLSPTRTANKETSYKTELGMSYENASLWFQCKIQIHQDVLE